jgi:hypothetical protein
MPRNLTLAVALSALLGCAPGFDERVMNELKLEPALKAAVPGHDVRGGLMGCGCGEKLSVLQSNYLVSGKPTLPSRAMADLFSDLSARVSALGAQVERLDVRGSAMPPRGFLEYSVGDSGGSIWIVYKDGTFHCSVDAYPR